MRISTKILSILSIPAFCSCVSVGQLSFDQLQPAEVSFPDKIRNVAVISTIPSENTDMQNDGKLDSLVFKKQNKLKEFLAKRIADSNYFDKVVICDSIISNDYTYNDNSFLSDSLKNELISDLGADLIVSLDDVDIMLNKINGSEEQYPFDILRSIAVPHIKLYVPQKSMPICIIGKRDTTYYSSFEIHGLDNLIESVSEDALDKNVDLIVPHWTNAQRLYYTGAVYQMRDAEVAINRNDWDKAFDLWNEVYNSKKGKLKCAAAFNIALFYEYKDNIQEAMKWIKLAEDLTKPDSDMYADISLYKRAIMDRYTSIIKLNAQMSRFNLNN